MISEVLMTTANEASPKYDLLLKGGRVIDPANNVDGLFDVAIVGRFIALVDKDISSALSLRVADVTGLIVTPGLVDLHAHFYGYSAAVHPDAHCLPEGTTTAVDVGGSGHLTFDDFDEKNNLSRQNKRLRSVEYRGRGNGWATGAGSGRDVCRPHLSENCSTSRSYRRRKSRSLSWTRLGTARSWRASRREHWRFRDGRPGSDQISPKQRNVVRAPRPR